MRVSGHLVGHCGFIDDFLIGCDVIFPFLDLSCAHPENHGSVLRNELFPDLRRLRKFQGEKRKKLSLKIRKLERDRFSVLHKGRIARREQMSADSVQSQFLQRLLEKQLLRAEGKIQFERKGIRRTGVDRVFLLPDPVCKTGENVIGFRREVALGRRTDVQEVVGVLFDQGDQLGDDLFRGFPVMIVVFESPGVVEGAGGLHGVLQAVAEKLIVAKTDKVVTVVPDPAVDHAVRLEFLHKGPELLAEFRFDVHRTVAPEFADLSVIGQEFGDLRNHFSMEVAGEVFFRAVRKIPVVSPVHVVAVVAARGIGIAAVLLMPVEVMRVVDAEFDAVFFTCVLEFPERIASERGHLHDIVVGDFRVVHAEPVVMFRREDNIADSRFRRLPDPLVRIEFDRIEFRCEFRVFLIRHPEIGLEPFADRFHDLPVVAPSGERIEAPVNEHAEFPVAKSLNRVCRHEKISL